MTLSKKVDDDNAECIGQPLFERYIQFFSDADHQGLIKDAPEIEGMMPQGRFEKKVENIKPLGDPTSNEYLARLNRIDCHDLYWKVQYESQQDVLWKLSLAEVDGVIIPIAIDFGTVYQSSDIVTGGFRKFDDSSVSIVNQLLETVIRFHEQSDFQGYIQKFPELDSREFFDEVVVNLKPVGRIKSIQYLTRLNKPKHHQLAWKVQYEKEDEDLLWELHLSGTNGDEKLVGLGFSR